MPHVKRSIKQNIKRLKACDRRVAELHDIELFKQPPQKEDDCPICFVHLPFLGTGSKYKGCCGKIICSGCIHAVNTRDKGVVLCPFCRAPPYKSHKEMIERITKRVELNDAKAMSILADYYSNGAYGLPQDYTKALKLWHRAAELGCALAYSNIGLTYLNGNGVDIDMKKAVHYWELAAIGGDAVARHNLGGKEAQAGNREGIEALYDCPGGWF